MPLYTNLLAVDDEHGPVVGVINMPALGETVWAGRGLGCFGNGRPVTVSSRDRIAGAYLSTSGSRLLDRRRDARGVKRAGCQLRTWGDGYGYALVATGRIEAMCDPEVALWDVAPMPVILSEAGGRFTDLDGGPGPGGGHGLATNGVLHEAWLARFEGLPRT